MLICHLIRNKCVSNANLFKYFAFRDTRVNLRICSKINLATSAKTNSRIDSDSLKVTCGKVT